MKRSLLYIGFFILGIVACKESNADTLEDVADTTYYTSQVLTFLDWRMTRDCLKRDDCHEVNPVTIKIIGHDPHEDKLDILMFGIMGANLWLQYQLPTKGRILYNSAQTYIRYDAVKHHFEIGLEVQL